MKKISYYLIALALLFATACKKDIAEVSVDENEIEMDELGYETRSISVSTTHGAEWSYEVSAEWLKAEKQGNKLILSSPMYVYEDGPRKATITIKTDKGGEEQVEVEQENIFIGKIAQGGLIYWLNPNPEKVQKGGIYPDCAGLVLALDETPRGKDANWISVDKENHWKDLKEFREKFENVDLGDTNDGMLLTKTYLGVIESFKGRIELPPASDCTSPEQDKGNPFSWFVESYWKKEVEGHSDWYIPSFEELFLICGEGPTPKHPGTGIYEKLNKILETKGATKMSPLSIKREPTYEEILQGYAYGWSYTTLSNGEPYNNTPERIRIAKKQFRCVISEITEEKKEQLADPNNPATFRSIHSTNMYKKIGSGSIRPIRRF